MENWNSLSMSLKLSVLAGTYEIDAFILREDDNLMVMLRNKAEYDKIEEYICNNY